MSSTTPKRTPPDEIFVETQTPALPIEQQPIVDTTSVEAPPEHASQKIGLGIGFSAISGAVSETIRTAGVVAGRTAGAAKSGAHEAIGAASRLKDHQPPSPRELANSARHSAARGDIQAALQKARESIDATKNQIATGISPDAHIYANVYQRLSRLQIAIELKAIVERSNIHTPEDSKRELDEEYSAGLQEFVDLAENGEFVGEEDLAGGGVPGLRTIGSYVTSLAHKIGYVEGAKKVEETLEKIAPWHKKSK